MRYELYENAGQVPLPEWASRGIKIPVFDKDGTLTDFNSDNLIKEATDALVKQNLSQYFLAIALVSNNKDPIHIHDFADHLAAVLGIQVYAICAGEGYRRKPYTIKPDQLGVVGDRWISDVLFAMWLGAGAIALTEKAGDGDDIGVPMVRLAERGIIEAHKKIDNVRK